MTTLNAKANNAYHALIATYERANPDHMWPAFDDERHAFEEGWERGYEAAATEALAFLRKKRSEAITGERQNAYDLALTFVAGLRP